MKKRILCIVCLATMMLAGTSLMAQQITITLLPGWTWISYPRADTLDFSTALGTFTPVEGDMIKSQFGFSEYHDGYWAGSISQFCPGLGYMYYSARTMPVMLVFGGSTQNQVFVTTSEPMLITAISAMGGGEVTVNDGTYIIVKGLCWATHENPTTNDDFYQEAESGVGSFSLSMTDLNISTTYYVRAYAVTSNGTVYGDQKTFTTRDGIPTLTTAEVTNIAGATATCGGDITDNGGLNVTARGVCWSTSPNPSVADPHTTNGSGTGSFNSSITGLNVSTTYYVRAYATTAAGTAYGEEKTFITRDGIPTLTTAEVANIQGASATCGGNITDNGGLNVTARGVCWSTSPNPTITDSHTSNGSGSGSFSSSITGLNVNTTYYVRAYATTAAITAYGEEKTFTTRDGVAVVTTAELTDISYTTATCGGIVTDDGGLAVTSRGVCWSTESNPTISDLHSINGSGTGNFSSTLTGLMPNTTYYVRAYATNSLMTVYGSELSFTTSNHAYVDLGLPSGLLWATCNVGADTPEAYGDYFAWGETTPKDTYDWGTYQYSYGNSWILTKYCNNSSYGYNGFTDNLTILLPEDDAATANWGDGWRMPTKAEFEELYNNTTVTWTTQNGMNGMLFTASNCNSLFLPALGAHWGDNDSPEGVSYEGNYWSSSLSTDNPTCAWRFYFDPVYYEISDEEILRNIGFTVRPVRSSQNNAPIGAINGKFTINADGDQVYFSQGNLQYQASTNTWKFAENQWDFVGMDNANISNTYDGWIDLFGWGTSGYNHGAVCYQPWSTSEVFSDYYAYGNWEYNLYEETGQADWGYNAITNGNNTENIWRTLTRNEWYYLFNTRNTISGIRWTQGKVNGINGIILLPDNWTVSVYALNSTNGGDFDSNIISETDWDNILEANGAVFLPAAGYRIGNSVQLNVGLNYYWSASHYLSNSSYASNNAYGVYFFSGYLDVRMLGRREGRSVRLVSNAE